jgi:hypothetical protein
MCVCVILCVCMCGVCLSMYVCMCDCMCVYVWCVSKYVRVYVCICMYFFKSLLTSMFHYRIATLHAKSFLLQSLVTHINTVYTPYLSQSSYIFKIPI